MNYFPELIQEVDALELTELEKIQNARPLKCGYNPYICLWDDEDNFVNIFDSGMEIIDGEYQLNEKVLEQTLEKIWK